MDSDAGNEQLENILQSMGDAFVSLNRQWQYTFVNNRALALMAKPKEALLGKTLWEVFPDTIGTTFDTEYRKVMDRRENAVFETHYPSCNMWLEVRAYPHEDGIAIFYTDITLRKEAEAQILSFNSILEQKVKERTDELEQSRKDMESFAYSVSHDLRAPLRAIHGYMSIFMEDYSTRFDEEATRLSGIILQNTGRMEVLINDLLELSKLGRQELTRAVVSMSNLVNAVWKDVAGTDPARQVEFVLGSLPDAEADGRTMKQVWINLLSNAFKYTRQKEKALIEVGAEKQGNDTVYYVRDNGAGFDMTYYGKLFGVFQRLHSQEEFEGTGVGLAIVQKIIHKHGGRVWAEASPGQGAVFYFSLQKGVPAY